MSGGIEVAGDIATGALIGRAFEPRAGEGHAGGAAHGLCLNCGTALIGDYCHACGQAEHVHRTLSSIAHDLLHGVFHFEGKIWRTLPMLALHPGALTRRYVAGERARFVSPLALFLFSVFLMFAVIHSVSGDFDSIDSSPAGREQRVAKVDAVIAKTMDKLKAAEAKQKADPASDGGDVADLKDALSKLQTARDTIAVSKDGHTKVTFKSWASGWAALDRGIAKANANPGLALYKLQSSAYKFSWALIPISVPFVALLFLWRRQYKLYDHAIFVTYSLSFMMLLVVALSIGGMVGLSAGMITLVALLAPPVHMFAQLRGAYSLRKRSALWRTIALMMFAFIALVAFSMLLLILGMLE